MGLPGGRRGRRARDTRTGAGPPTPASRAARPRGSPSTRTRVCDGRGATRAAGQGRRAGRKRTAPDPAPQRPGAPDVPLRRERDPTEARQGEARQKGHEGRLGRSDTQGRARKEGAATRGRGRSPFPSACGAPGPATPAPRRRRQRRGPGAKGRPGAAPPSAENRRHPSTHTPRRPVLHPPDSASLQERGGLWSLWGLGARPSVDVLSAGFRTPGAGGRRALAVPDGPVALRRSSAAVSGVRRGARGGLGRAPVPKPYLPWVRPLQGPADAVRVPPAVDPNLHPVLLYTGKQRFTANTVIFCWNFIFFFFFFFGPDRTPPRQALDASDSAAPSLTPHPAPPANRLGTKPARTAKAPLTLTSPPSGSGRRTTLTTLPATPVLE